MRVVVSTEIAVPRQRVWDHIADPDRFIEFMDGMTRWEAQGTRRSGVGTRFAMRLHVGSVELGGLVEIVEFDPPCDMAWTGITGVDHRGRWRLRQGTEGRTRVELRVTYHAPGGIIGSIADLVAWPMVRAHLQRSLGKLARQIEGRPTTRSAATLVVQQHHSGRARTALRQQ